MQPKNKKKIDSALFYSLLVDQVSGQGQLMTNLSQQAVKTQEAILRRTLITAKLNQYTNKTDIAGGEEINRGEINNLMNQNETLRKWVQSINNMSLSELKENCPIHDNPLDNTIKLEPGQVTRMHIKPFKSKAPASTYTTNASKAACAAIAKQDQQRQQRQQRQQPGAGAGPATEARATPPDSAKKSSATQDRLAQIVLPEFSNGKVQEYKGDFSRKENATKKSTHYADNWFQRPLQEINHQLKSQNPVRAALVNIFGREKNGNDKLLGSSAKVTGLQNYESKPRAPQYIPDTGELITTFDFKHSSAEVTKNNTYKLIKTLKTSINKIEDDSQKKDAVKFLEGFITGDDNNEVETKKNGFEAILNTLDSKKEKDTLKNELKQNRDDLNRLNHTVYQGGTAFDIIVDGKDSAETTIIPSSVEARRAANSDKQEANNTPSAQAWRKKGAAAVKAAVNTEVNTAVNAEKTTIQAKTPTMQCKQ